MIDHLLDGEVLSDLRDVVFKAHLPILAFHCPKGPSTNIMRTLSFSVGHWNYGSGTPSFGTWSGGRPKGLAIQVSPRSPASHSSQMCTERVEPAHLMPNAFGWRASMVRAAAFEGGLEAFEPWIFVGFGECNHHFSGQ